MTSTLTITETFNINEVAGINDLVVVRGFYGESQDVYAALTDQFGEQLETVTIWSFAHDSGAEAFMVEGGDRDLFFATREEAEVEAEIIMEGLQGRYEPPKWSLAN